MSEKKLWWLLAIFLSWGFMCFGIGVHRGQTGADRWYAQHPVQREHYISGMEIRGACFIEPPENGTAYFSDNTIILTEQQCSIIPTRGAK